MEAVDFESPLAVRDIDAAEISVPVWLSHAGDTDYFYVARRANGCGVEEKTLSAAVKVSIGPDGNLRKDGPNEVFGLTARVIDSDKVELSWFYCPLEQKAEPACFDVYGDSGDGVIDYENELASIEYKGRLFYSYTSPSLEAGRYVFAVRAVAADGTDDGSHRSVAVQIITQQPTGVTVLDATAF